MSVGLKTLAAAPLPGGRATAIATNDGLARVIELLNQLKNDPRWH